MNVELELNFGRDFEAKLWSMSWSWSLAKNSKLKGELNRFFLSAQSFYRPQTKASFKRQFSRKAPKWVKNQVKGSKIDQIRTKWHPTCWGNPPILSLELLRESINSVLWPTEGILLLTISPILSSELLREPINSVIRPTEGIHSNQPAVLCQKLEKKKR